jgi:hypothetical protein
MTDLIARLEAATGPDRYLDWDIAIAFGVVTARQVGDRVWYSRPGRQNFLGVLTGDDGGRGNFGAAVDECRYTESLDAALTLLTKKVSWTVGSYADRYSACVDGRLGFGTTPAVALVIAILQAKEQKP